LLTVSEHSESYTKPLLTVSEHSESYTKPLLTVSEHSESYTKALLTVSEHSESYTILRSDEVLPRSDYDAGSTCNIITRKNNKIM
jgi:hypothetical protein